MRKVNRLNIPSFCSGSSTSILKDVRQLNNDLSALLSMSPDDAKRKIETCEEAPDIFKAFIKESTCTMSAGESVTKFCHEEVWSGCGLMKFGNQIIRFDDGQYYDGRIYSNLNFKLRAGKNKKLGMDICIVKTGADHYFVPDFVLFRGKFQPDKDFCDSVSTLIYCAKWDFLSFSNSYDCPSSTANDTIFLMLYQLLCADGTKKLEVKNNGKEEK